MRIKKGVRTFRKSAKVLLPACWGSYAIPKSYCGIFCHITDLMKKAPSSLPINTIALLPFFFLTVTQCMA